jgi:hypothetical protein
MDAVSTSPTDFATLRYAARLVLCRGLDGRTFAAAVDATPAAFGRDGPGPTDVVRETAVYIRWRMPEASPAEVARYLVRRANRLEAKARGR